MSLSQTLTTTLFASLWFSWIALLIACLPTLLAMTIASKPHRLQYLIAGFLGSLAGEFCGVASLFLSLWLSCRGQSQCNDAQGGMGLIITVPAGSLLGCVFALFWTWMSLKVHSESAWAWVFRYSGANEVKNWICVIGVPMAIWVLTTLFFARLFA
jgi:hypothetical protein